MRAAARMLFAVCVIAGWLMALVWVALSVSQIAVERTLLPTCTSVVAVAGPGELACSR